MQTATLDWAKNWFESEKLNYISGEWRCSEGDAALWRSMNPATGEELCSYRLSGSSDVEAAVGAAQKTFRSSTWHGVSRNRRAELLRGIAQLIRKHHAELATIEALSNGKLYTEAYNDDIPEAADVFDYYAGWVDKFYGQSSPVESGFVNYTRREPVGVCGLIIPWNFPLLLACWKLAPALVTGNCVVVKPSEFTPFSLVRLFELIDRELDFPPGVINLLLGDGRTGSLICGHQGVNKVSFTGSTEVGKAIVRQSADSNLKTVTLELGGKSPNIFFEDTPEFESAVQRAYGAMFSHKGEKCSEPTRLFLHESLYDRALEMLTDMAQHVVCGDPFSADSDQGAQCNQDQFDKIMSYIESGVNDGARLLCGGKRDVAGSNSRGLFVRPTIFADADNKMKISQEEIFGPVLTVMRFSTEEEVVQMANDTSYGLAAGLYTSDVSRAHRVAEQLDAGMVFVNQYGCYDFSTPFGGFKQSGWGKEMGWHALESYTKLKSIWLKL